jgi:hypothetical protein
MGFADALGGAEQQLPELADRTMRPYTGRRPG